MASESIAHEAEEPTRGLTIELGYRKISANRDKDVNLSGKYSR